MWIEKMFKVKKPIIAMLHLDALPGDPRFDSNTKMTTIIDHARADLNSLQDGGVDGILISNEMSLPYQRHVNFVTPASMARIIGELKHDISVPFGVDCISDGQASIELAAAVDADFVRGTFSGVYVGDGGFYNNDISNILRIKKSLFLSNLKLLYFINPESDINLDTRSLVEIAKSLVFKAHPDGMCVSAAGAGQDVNNTLMSNVKKSLPNEVVICNTGCRPETIEEKLKIADAAIVGTYFKENGNLENDNFENVRVDKNRVQNFMKIVQNIRNNLK